MDETTETAGHRARLRDKLLAREGGWFMGRFAPRELLEGVGRYLRLQTPERRDELLDAIRTRAEEIAEADQDLPVDAQSTGMLTLGDDALAKVKAGVTTAEELLRVVTEVREMRSVCPGCSGPVALDFVACLRRERREAELRKETRPLWQLLVCIGLLMELGLNRTDSDLLRAALAAQFEWMAQQPSIDPGGECKERIQLLLE